MEFRNNNKKKFTPHYKTAGANPQSGETNRRTTSAKPWPSNYSAGFTINNQTLIAVVILTSAVLYFSFWRIFLATNENLIPAIDISSPYSDVKKAKNTDTVSKSAPLILPVLMYHHIGPLPEDADFSRKDLTISASDFELQTAWLKGQGYASISLTDLLNYSKNKFTLPEKPIIFTFDDGYKDTFENAVPILKKYGFTGSFAIITQFPGIKVGTNEYADWRTIRSAKAQGMEIIDHTQDHFDGTDAKYGDTIVLQNLENSRSDLKNNLGISLPILVYPYDKYNAKYLELAKQAGFEMGITTKEGEEIFLDNLMEIPRVRIHGGTVLEKFKELILE